MKKLILLILVAMVPYFTMAQKRSKKNKKEEAIVLYDFMIIKGVEVVDRANMGFNKMKNEMSKEELFQFELKANLHTKIHGINFDFGGDRNKDNDELVNSTANCHSMAAAVSAAADKGWEFQSANVIPVGTAKFHYYYMRKNK